jgi:hypothetical protein
MSQYIIFRSISTVAEYGTEQYDLRTARYDCRARNSTAWYGSESVL